jgi:hypothetical protein
MTITDTSSATAGHGGNELRGGRAMRGGREGRGARGGSRITPAAATTIDSSATVGGRGVAHLLTLTMTLSDDKAGTFAGQGGRGLGHNNSSLVLPTPTTVSIAASSNPRATTTDVASTCEESLLQSSNDAGHISSRTISSLTTTAEVSITTSAEVSTTTTIALNAGEVQQPEINRQDNIILLTDDKQVPSESLNACLLLQV